MGLYSEGALIEQPAIELFKSLGYVHQDCYNETFGKTRDNYKLVGLKDSNNAILLRS